jgi:hypothetical protein
MKLKDDIIKNIEKMNVSELLLVKNMILNISKVETKNKAVLKGPKNKEAEKVRMALKGIQLSDDIQFLREDRP